MDRTKPVLQVAIGLAVAMGIALFGCSRAGDAASDREKLIGSYRLAVGTNQPVTRKDLESSVLKLAPDGTFIQECRYAGGNADSVELTSPTTILLSPDINVRYERMGDAEI